MRILMLSWEYPPNIVGGISRHVEELAGALAGRDLKIHVITCQAKNAPDEEEIDSVFVHRVPVDGEMTDFLPWIRSLNHYTEEKAGRTHQKVRHRRRSAARSRLALEVRR